MTQIGDRTYLISFPFPYPKTAPITSRFFRLFSTPRVLRSTRMPTASPAKPTMDTPSTSPSTPSRRGSRSRHRRATSPGRLTTSTSGSARRSTRRRSRPDVTIIKPDGQTVAATSIQNVGLNRFRISFPAQTLVGTYHVKIGPNVADLAGNLLDQDRDGIVGERRRRLRRDVQPRPGRSRASNLDRLPAALVAGEPVTVSWSGSNQTGAPLAGRLDRRRLPLDRRPMGHQRPSAWHRASHRRPRPRRSL